MQRKTFTKWINNKLQPRNLQVENLAQDFSDGTILINLLEVIGDETLGKYNKAPKLRLQKIENMNSALQFIKSRNVQLHNIGAEGAFPCLLLSARIGVLNMAGRHCGWQ